MVMKNKIKNIVPIILNALPWILLISGVIYNVYYIVGPGKMLIDSDLSTEMILADVLNKEHSILTTNWWYSYELRVFSVQWFFRLGLLIFPHNWSLARAFATTLILILLISGYYFVGKICKFQNAALWIGAIAVWPFGDFYQYFCNFSGIYWVHHVFTLFGVGLVLISAQNDNSKIGGVRQKVFTLLGIILAMMSGFNGIRQVMTLYAPLAATTFILLVLSIRNEHPKTIPEILTKSAYELRMFVISLLNMFGAGVGYMITSKILAKTYEHEALDNVILTRYSWRGEILSFLYQFGFKDNVPLMSVAGITSLIGMAIGASIFFSAFLLMRRFSKLNKESKFLTLISIMAIVINLIILCSLDYYHEYYWILMIPFGFILVMVEISTEEFNISCFRELILIVASLGIIATSVQTVKYSIDNPRHTGEKFYNVAKWIEGQGYTVGSMDGFWEAQTLTEMTNGKIEVWTVADYAGGILKWLQKKDHLDNKPQGRQFLVLVGSYEETKDNYRVQLGNGILVYGDESYSVYEFNNSDWMVGKPDE